MNATASRSKKRPRVRVEELELHGHRYRYRIGGEGPAIVLIHGITGSSETWSDVLPRLACDYTVLAPDLLGHGDSAKPRGDYSLGAYASGIRDLALALDIDRATYLGHSLGGGIAMQFAYQFPERLERLVLVSSGGLGKEVHLMLRLVALPGAEYVLPLIYVEPLRNASNALVGLLGRLGIRPSSDIAEIAAGFTSLGDVDARQAFIHTARSIIDIEGQRASAKDKLYLAEEVPTLLMWGERDPVIPTEHGRDTQREIPHSRLELFPDAGHFPYLDDPQRFVDALSDFIEDTEPADLRPEDIRDQLLKRAGR